MSADAPRNTFTVASFNTRWGRDISNTPFDLGVELERLDTDLIALQEVWFPSDGTGQLRPAAERLGYSVVEAHMAGSNVDPTPFITTDTGEMAGSWGTAFLTRMPIITTRTVDLGRLVERWDIATRYVILTEVEIAPSEIITFATVHLSFAMPNALAQLRRLRALLPRQTHSVVVGDFNMWGPLATSGLRGWSQSVRGRTWPAHRPHSQLDHILVSSGIDVISASVLSHAGSDHRPVRASLRVNCRS